MMVQWLQTYWPQANVERSRPPVFRARSDLGEVESIVGRQLGDGKAPGLITISSWGDDNIIIFPE
jgi:hypothetical protein